MGIACPETGRVKPMNNTRKTTALALALLAATLVVAAPPVAAEPPAEDTDADCPVVAVLLYYPYVSVKPDCLTVPPSFP